MPSDALLQLQLQITSVATAHSAGLVLPKAGMINPLYVRFDYSAAQQASGSGIFTFGCSVSYDGGVNWFADWIAADESVTLSSTAQGGEFAIGIQLLHTELIQPGNAAIPAPQLRADLVLSGSPVTPTITWSASIQPSKV